MQWKSEVTCRGYSSAGEKSVPLCPLRLLIAHRILHRAGGESSRRAGPEGKVLQSSAAQQGVPWCFLWGPLCCS